jgi:hypothetical protein
MFPISGRKFLYVKAERLPSLDLTESLTKW